MFRMFEERNIPVKIYIRKNDDNHDDDDDDNIEKESEKNQHRCEMRMKVCLRMHTYYVLCAVVVLSVSGCSCES